MKFTKQQVNYFVLGWLLVHPNGSSTVVDRNWYKTHEYVIGAVQAYIFDGVPLDGCRPLAISCAQAVEAAFGRVVPKLAPTMAKSVHDDHTLPEIHHDNLPHSEDPWNSSFTRLT